jgi:uncharacterized protein YjiS (DUF1127 family)
MTALENTGILRYSRPAVAVGRMLARAKGFLHRLSEKHYERVAAQRLQSMSDWQLKDLGIHRSQIPYLVHGISASSTRRGNADD